MGVWLLFQLVMTVRYSDVDIKTGDSADVGSSPNDINSTNCWFQGIGKDVPQAQRTPVMGNPYISPVARGYLWVIIIILKNP